MIRLCQAVAASLSLAFSIGITAQAAPPRLQPQTDITLPGPTGRFDYATRDPQTGYLWLNQMGADRLLVFDPKTRHVVGVVHGLSTPTGITLAPRRRLAFVSNAGNLLTRAAGHGSVAVVNLDTRKIIARLPAGHFPDGSAWVARVGRLFVSDEMGATETVIGGTPLRVQKTIPLGGEAGMSVYDAADGWVLVNVQTKNRIVAIDPQTLKITHRWTLPPSCRHNHGLLMGSNSRRAFVACDGNARLLVLSLPNVALAQPPLRLGRDPDVLALDPRHHRLVVAAESGIVAIFTTAADRLQPLWRGRVGPDAHVVVVNPVSGVLYFPLKDLHGHPTLRIAHIQPADSGK